MKKTNLKSCSLSGLRGKKLFLLIASCFVLSVMNLVAQNPCHTTSNHIDGIGGTSSDQTVKSSNGCKTLVMDTGFETITLNLGNVPTESADFTIVNHDATPGENEISITYFYASGNTPETLEFTESGKTAHICINGSGLTVTWNGINFKGSANGKLTYKTNGEMTCTGM